MNTKFRAKLKTADEILGTKGVAEFRSLGNLWGYKEKMNERAKKGEVGTCEPSNYNSSILRIDFDDGDSYYIYEGWFKDVEEKAEPKVESKYPEFTEENVDGILEKCIVLINELLGNITKYLPFPNKTLIETSDKKIEDFMNVKKQLALKIIDTLSKMFKSSCCPFCEANTSVDKSIPNLPCIKTYCSKCSYGKYYNTCEESSFSIYHNIRKANEQLREAIEKHWR